MFPNSGQFSFAAIVLVITSSAGLLGQGPTGPGVWSAPIDFNVIQAGSGDREIGHAALMLNHVGGPRVLLWYYENQSGPTTRTFLYNPSELVDPFLEEIIQSLGTNNIFCSHHVFLDDGRLIACGGLVGTAGTCCFPTDLHCNNYNSWIYDPQAMS
jgi:hypothetical protein